MTSIPAIAKVIATGESRPGYLRATVMLMPSVRGLDGVMPEWPRRVIAGLRDGKWKLQLAAVSMPSTAEVDKPPRSWTKPPIPVQATAYAMKAFWEHNQSDDWLVELWRDAFYIKSNPRDRREIEAQEVWLALAEVIERSATNIGYRAGKIGETNPTSKDTSTSDDRAKAVKTLSPDATSTTTVDTILPSQQSALAVMLELKRARELCNTVWWAYGDSQARSCEEAECCSRQLRVTDGDRRDWTAALKLSAAKTFASASTGVCQRRQTDLPPTEEIARKNISQLDASLDIPIDSHEAANQRQSVDPTYGDTFDEVWRKRSDGWKKVRISGVGYLADTASQRFYAIQGNPALSRLFGLTIDVEFEASQIGALVDNEYCRFAVDDSRFAPAIRFPLFRPTPPQIWSLAKYRNRPGETHFWPVSRAEEDLARNCCATNADFVDKYDGLLVLAQKWASSSNDRFRFDITSLDVRAAAEAEIDKRRARIADKQARDEAEAKAAQTAGTVAAGAIVPTAGAVASASVTAPASAKPGAPLGSNGQSDKDSLDAPRKTHHTAGLVVLDLGRQYQLISQLAGNSNSDGSINPDRTKSSADWVTIDSDDLCIGYRMDVGVRRLETQKYEWRTLAGRDLEYGIGGLHASRVKAAIDTLLPRGRTAKPTSADEWRETLLDGVIALPTRLIPTRDGTVDAYVEETIATWTGDPMAVQCGGSRGDKVVPCDIGIGSVMRPPGANKLAMHRRPPPLRFGTPYRLGFRVVYPGGISVPLSSAKLGYDNASGDAMADALTYPPREPNQNLNAETRRFLRHERVGCPFLLMPERLALTRWGEMGRERSAHAIVRTCFAKTTRNRESPTVTQRIFVAPNVPQALATLHGVFDDKNEACPRDGLQGVRFDAEGGGFPVATCDVISGLNGEPYESTPRVSTRMEDQGDLVFSTRAETRPSRTIPYYPDPAAREYAIGIRYAGTDCYLDGGPLTVPIYDSARNYPNARPLVITIGQSKSRGRRPVTRRVEDILTRTVRPGSVALTEVPNAMHVGCTLLPGDDFEIDVWCIPDKNTLAKNFAVIESIGVLAVAEAGSDSNSPQVIYEALRSLLPEPVCADYKACLSRDSRMAFHDTRGGLRQGFRGLGGVVGPDTHSLDAIAFAVYNALRRRPLEEISSIRTLRVTHATDQPQYSPRFLSRSEYGNELDGDPYPFRVTRTQPKKSGGDPARDGNLSQLDYAIDGNLAIDLATSGAFDIVAHTAFPTASAFDDSQRQRSILDRRKGNWPNDLANRVREPLEVFGFDVGEDGEVRLPRCDVTLMRVDALPTPQAVGLPVKSDGRCVIPLTLFFDGTSITPLGIVKGPHIFPDKKARCLDLTVRAYSRHGAYMQTAKRPARDGYWLRDGKDLEANEVRLESYAPLRVWLPADVRPAKPAARSPIPAFSWTRSPATKSANATKRVSRTSVVRIPLGRGWFSSGEGELLGIVVWPPNLLDHPSDLLNDDRVKTMVEDEHRRDSSHREDPRTMDLQDFVDEDLGPGGAFITRWGGDPIRSAKSSMGRVGNTFIPREAFADLTDRSEGAFEVMPVKSVEMPIEDGRASAASASANKAADVAADSSVSSNAAPGPKADPSAGGGTKPADLAPDDPETTLRVSLLTYRPRFDIEAEEWYVDVGIKCAHEAEPFVRFGLVRYQPHAPADKQVSYPIVQWAQLLPQRDVEVTPRTTKTQVAADVQVLGLAVEGTNAAHAYAKQHMAARLIREYQSPGKQLLRHVVGEVDLAATITSPETFQCAWNTTADRKLEYERDTERDKNETAKYYVFIEEYEERRPATYPSEPIGIDMIDPDPRLVPAGPRFQVRVDL